VSAGWLNVGVAPPAFTLSLTKTPGARRRTINLAWEGADGRRVDVYRDGALLDAKRNDGAYSQRRPAGTWAYQICEQGSNSTCSAELSITAP
jgi:hypothetical protein